MSILNQQFFQMSNAIFCYGLKPIQLAVYSYLRCCAGKKETCFPRMKTIAASCSCSESAAREAIRELERRADPADQQHLLHPGPAGHLQAQGRSRHHPGGDSGFWGGKKTSRIKNRRRFAARSATNARSAGVFRGL